MSADSCFVCKFRHEEGSDLYCRRHPPHAVVGPKGQLMSSFPPVHRAAWCGDFVKQIVLAGASVTSIPLK